MTIAFASERNSCVTHGSPKSSPRFIGEVGYNDPRSGQLTAAVRPGGRVSADTSISWRKAGNVLGVTVLRLDSPAPRPAFFLKRSPPILRFVFLCLGGRASMDIVENKQTFSWQGADPTAWWCWMRLKRPMRRRKGRGVQICGKRLVCLCIFFGGGSVEEQTPGLTGFLQVGSSSGGNPSLLRVAPHRRMGLFIQRT